MIGRTISHYKILDKLGEGGMGVVYKAEDTKLKRVVALKFLSRQALGAEDDKTRFIHEAQAAASLNHPNICTVYEIDETEGQTFIAMEYVEGQSLRDRGGSGPLKVEEAVRVGLQIAEALQRAHDKGVVHRDIKSGNLMITPDGQVKVMDFGLAKLAGASRLTREGTTVGTVAYMSPEQARGEETDRRTDIWSLGVVLYEMLTGLLPFQRDYEQATVYSILNEEPQPVTGLRSGIPMELERIVARALDKDVETRYQSAADMAADLKRARKGLESAATLPSVAGMGPVATGPAATAPDAPGPTAASAPTGPSPPGTTPQQPSRGAPEMREAEAARKKSLKRFLVPATIVAVAVFLVLVFRPWRFELRPTHEAVAEENSLAIMYFDNLVEPDDPGRLGEIVTNLLITDLSDSRYVQVVSSQRLYDILKSLGREGTKVIDREVASQVAKKAQAKWMLLGSILQVEPRLVVTAQVVDVASGKAIASQRIQGESGEEIFSLVDRLTVQVKEDLSLPAAARTEADRRVAEVTTHSTEAFRYYLEGKDYFYKYMQGEATLSFERAVELDPTFAMAYYGLSLSRQLSQEQIKAINKAAEHLDRVSSKERRFILARRAELNKQITEAIRELESIVRQYPNEKEAYFRLARVYQMANDWEKTLEALLKVIEIDPTFKEAYNVLAYQYAYLGQFEKSIWAINKYIELAPDEPNPYDSRGDLYALNGKLEEAIGSYEKAIEVEPNFMASVENLGDIHLFRGEYAEATSLYQSIASHSDKYERAIGRAVLANVPLYQGKFREALRMLEVGLETDRIELGEGVRMAEKMSLRAEIYDYLGDLESAISEAEKARDMMERANPSNRDMLLYIGHVPYLYIKKGEFEKAERMLAKMDRYFTDSDSAGVVFYESMRGLAAMGKGDYSAATKSLERSTEIYPLFTTYAALGRCYLEAGNLCEAVATLERATTFYDETRADDLSTGVRIHYWLGMAYER
ncbi:MAG: protein kinase, partial [Candidatus Eiseniibacteriota bacterium]